MHEVIDLSSDTATRPTEAMRRAIAAAEVGDAAFGKDPTVNLLEERVARLLDKEAALYVVSGTMANALAIRLCCEAGDEVITESNSHPVFYEAGGSGAFSGVIFKTLDGAGGILDPDEVAATIYDYAYYRPVQRAVPDQRHQSHPALRGFHGLHREPGLRRERAGGPRPPRGPYLLLNRSPGA